MNKLVVVAAQLNLLVGDIEGNTDRIIEVAERAIQEHQADVILFPELTLTGYPPEDLLFRPRLYLRVHQAIEKLCQQKSIQQTTIIFGYPDKIGGKCYNIASVLHEGQIKASYAKKSLPNYTVFDEKRYFSPGSENIALEVKGVKLGLVICEDIWFSAPVKEAVQYGADILLCINASPFATDKTFHRRNTVKQRCHEINIPIVYLNSVGGQDELVFDGGSMVFDRQGQVCQQAKYFSEDLMKIEFDIADAFNVLTQHPPKPEPLDEEKVYNALVLGVRDYIEKNHFPGAIIGLSGGIDSALTLAIACDAIGSSRVEAVMMPSHFTTDMSLNDAKTQADTMQAKYKVISIEKVFAAFNETLQEEFKDYPADTTEENLQARCRGTILMAISNKKGALVLTTGNKSEMAVGYATLYGDMAGGFSVLKDVYKTMVYRLCRYRNTLSPVIPESVMVRPPSAELAENQKDQDILPPYDVLDEILERFVVKDQDAYTIANDGFDLNTVKKIVRMVNQNEYKRRQAPVGIRLTEKAFGKDRRYPITSGYFKSYSKY